MPELTFSRRRMLGSGLLGAGLLGSGLAATPAWARGASLRHGGMIRRGFDEVYPTSASIDRLILLRAMRSISHRL